MNRNTVHPTAIIGPDVDMGTGNTILPYTVITGRVTLGDNNTVGPFATIGTAPQHGRDGYRDGAIIIGDDNVIREYVTIHLPCQHKTSVGNRCYLMAYSHVSHDTWVGDDVTLSNGAQLGGYSVVMHHAWIGLNASVHQHSTIGPYVIVGMGGIVTKDIPPGLKYINTSTAGLNVVGLERAGIHAAARDQLARFYSRDRNMPFGARLEPWRDAWFSSEFSDFLALSKRAICKDADHTLEVAA